MEDFKRLDGESENQYLWRIDCLIAQGKYKNWGEVTDIVNKELYGDDEQKYKQESAYRKKCKYARDMYNDVFSKMLSNTYNEQLQEQLRELEIAKVQFRDERNAWNKQNRDEGRYKANLDIINRTLMKLQRTNFSIENDTNIDSDEDMLVCLSDLHFGEYNDSFFGTCNASVLNDRMQKYLNEIIKLQHQHKAENCYIALLGDLITGNIHKTIQIESRENVVEQIMIACEKVLSFAEKLSEYFNHVYIAAVSGNHTRLGKKDEVVRDERLDDLVVWFIDNMTKNSNKIEYIREKYDPTIANMHIRGKEYILVHGDYDKMDQNGLSKLIMTLDHKPDVVLFGHLHECEYKRVAGTQMVRSGCLSGTGGNFTAEKRIKSTPSQMVCICNDNGVKSMYPIDLG